MIRKKDIKIGTIISDSENFGLVLSIGDVEDFFVSLLTTDNDKHPMKYSTPEWRLAY